jgi:signal transduction histidine kinase
MSNRISAPAQRKPVRWHLVYFLLAGFDLIAICGSLYLGHQVMGIFQTSLDVNQAWAAKLADLSDLSRAAAAVNAPGNDLFDSHDVSGEFSRQQHALMTFNGQVELLQRSIEEVEDVAARRILQNNLTNISTSMKAMLDEADHIFSLFRKGDRVAAGRRMATMDRKFASLLTAIGDMAQSVREIQRAHFAHQVVLASYLGEFEYLFAGVVAFIVVCVLLYGHRIAIEFKRNEQERAERTARLEALSNELRNKVIEAEIAHKAKSNFLAMMSQEIHGPMAGVLSTSNQLIDTKLPTECHQPVVQIRDSAASLLGVISDILDFSALEAGAMRVEKSDFDPHELFRSAIDIISPRLKSKPVALNLVIESNVPRQVRSDTGRLQQILLNLLGNAVKFTERGSITLYASVREHALRVEVRDTGVGIQAEKLNKLLHSLQKADVAIPRHYGGTGLGLAIAKRLVDLLGGQIGAESARNVGSNFWFEIPLRIAAEQDVARDAFAGQTSVASLVGAPTAGIQAVADTADNPVALRRQIDAFVATTADNLARFAAMVRGGGNGAGRNEARRR